MHGHPAQPGFSDRSSPWAVVAAVLVGCWTVAVTVGHPDRRLGDRSGPAGLRAGPRRLALAGAGLANVAAGRRARPAAGRCCPARPAVRATGRAWLAGALALGVLTLLRAVPPVHHEAYLAGLTVVALLAARRALVGATTSGPVSTALGAAPGRRRDTDLAPLNASRRPAETARPRPDAAGIRPSACWPTGGALLAVAAGLALLLPWVWLGALGGLLETVSRCWPPPRGRRAGRDTARRHRSGPAFAGRPTAPAGPAGPGRWPGRRGGAAAARGRHRPVRRASCRAADPAAGGLRAGRAWAAAWRPTAARPSPRAPAGRRPAGWSGLAVLGPLAFTDPEEITLLPGRHPRRAVLGGGRRRRRARRRGAARHRVRGAARPAAARTPSRRVGRGGGRGRCWWRRRGRPRVRASPACTASGCSWCCGSRPTWPDSRPALRVGPGGTPGRRRSTGGWSTTAERTQADLRRELRRLRLDHGRTTWSTRSRWTAARRCGRWLSRRPEVARVLVSQRLRPLPAPAGPSRGDAPAPTGPQWNIRHDRRGPGLVPARA